jgi:hypothetical protein
MSALQCFILILKESMKLVTIFCQTQNVFPYLLEKKHFVQNVLGLGISSLHVNWMSINYKGWTETRVLGQLYDV